jgi:hypothetical protein
MAEGQSVNPVIGSRAPSEPPPIMPVSSGGFQSSSSKQNIQEQKNSSSLVDSLITQGSGTFNNSPAQSPSAPPAPPKKKNVTGMMLAGIIILLITLPIGIYFISQQNIRVTEQRSCAAGDGPCLDPELYPLTKFPGSCDNVGCCHRYSDATCWWKTDATHPSGYCLCTASDSSCTSWKPWSDCHKDSCVCVKTRYCGDGTNHTYQILKCDEAPCVPCDKTPTQKTSGSPTPTPTPLPGQCSRIRVYKNDVSVDPTTLSVGDVVKIAVKGTSANKGRIRVNGSAWTESNVKNDDDEYYISYTVPSGISSFTVEAEIYTNSQWK